jgi:hypothetical protein
MRRARDVAAHRLDREGARVHRDLLLDVADLEGHLQGAHVGDVEDDPPPPENRLAFALAGDAALRPLHGIAGIGNGDLPLWQHNRNSIYHALQVAIGSRFGHGSVLGLAYTWSKLMATGPVDYAAGGLDQAAAYRDSTQPNLDRARGGTDRTHMFNASLVLALPALREKSFFVRNVLGDWELTTIVQAGSGYPITVKASVSGLSGGPAGTGIGQLQTPNRVAGQSCTVSAANGTQWLNPAAFTLDGYPIGTNGNAGRNICDGPGMFQADASLYKNIGLGPSVKLQLRFEVFNVFNTVNFLGYSLNAGYVGQNVVFDTGNPATATRIVSATPPGTFGRRATRGPCSWASG